MTKKQFNIFVTGGAGNIGTNLCNELRARGHKVISCDVRNYRHENIYHIMHKIFRNNSLC